MTIYNCPECSPSEVAVSIVMPLYNKEETVGRALESVLSQTVTDFELSIVNDGSTDRGPDAVRSFKDRRIKILDQPNSGVSSARNRGVSEAQGDVIAFLDADDEWENDFLETILSLRREYPHCGVYGTSYFIRRPGHMRRAVLNKIPKALTSGILTDYFLIAAYSDPPLLSSAIAVTKEAMTAVGGFPEGISSGEDLLTWARLASQHDIAYCTVPKSSFWAPLKMSDRPGRVPQMPDRVGYELKRLSEEHPSRRMKGLSDYVALWHRMRAVIFIHLGERVNAVSEVREAMRARRSLKLCLLLILAMMPLGLSARFLTTLHAKRESIRCVSFDGRSAS